MKSVKLLYPLILFMFFSLACGSGLPLSFLTAATPTPAGVIDFEVTVIIPTPTSLPVTATPDTPVSSIPITSSLPVTTTAAEAQSAPLANTLPTTLPEAIEAAAFAPAPPPTAVPPTDLAQPVISPPAVTATVTPTQVVTAEEALTGTTSTQPAPPAAGFVLLEPFEAFTLQPGINELEFKWRWAAATGCQPPEGFGYELRIWPAVSGYSPMGVTDAVKSQQDFYCDPQGNVASYRVVDLKGTPGVAAMGSGKFLWDIAYIQLEPYGVVLSSEPRLFEMP